MANPSSPAHEKKRSRTMRELFTMPIGFNSVKELISKEQRSRFGGPAQETPNLDRQADDLIEHARELSRKEGISLEDALKRFGIEVGDAEAGEEVAAGIRDTMLKSLDWEVKAVEEGKPAPETAPKWVRRSAETLEEIRKSLDGLDREVVSELLASVSPEDEDLRDKLLALKFCSQEEWQAVVQRFRQQGQGAFWKPLLESPERDIRIFCDVLLTMPFSPIFFSRKGSFSEWLQENGKLSYRQFRETKTAAAEGKTSACRYLLKKETIGTDKSLDLLSEFCHMPVWKGSGPKSASPLLSALRRPWTDIFGVVPLRQSKESLLIGLEFPWPESLLKRLSEEVGKGVQPHLLDAQTATRLRSLFSQETTEESSVSPKKERSDLRIRHIVASASAVNLVRQLFEGALESRATDIHIEPGRDGSRVRFRIDGLCYPVMKMGAELAGEVVSRIKILAELDITEKRHPQDGHIKIGIQGQEYDMRIATVPSKHGEKIGVRLVYSGRVMKRMDDLGLDAEDYRKVKRFLAKPHGLILATGPVGSGKTTTLYSCLNEIDRDSNHIMSIEDPIELELPGANQVEVNYKLGFGFAEGLRALLRQDPNVILIGEIRDEETARIGVRASMTGLLVFSTLHTNDAPGAVTTLYNFHLPTHLIANSLVGVIAQRLLRRICPHCRTPYKPTAEELKSLGLVGSEAAKVKQLFRGKGCPQCLHSGYHDRIGVFEVMAVTPALRELIQEEAGESRIRQHAIQEGMRQLGKDGLSKVLAGETTSEEFLRVLGL